ncbi:MAG: non-homologous end-joining DNA ligase [Chloroflexi bacterium]|nr:non-homologous end-joining DNA ligase [Chloroflexota bacterium]
MARDDLHDYDLKRDLSLTPEPGGGRPAATHGPLTFVMQKHAARRLHYDLRLEMDGVYKSWAIPKGPSYDPSEKRLAVLVEDHPLEYGRFEGVIPKGEYGAGQDIVWDNGTYSPDEDGQLRFADRQAAQTRALEDLEAGKLSVRLRGRKLKGSWALVKTKQDPKSWLFFKHDDDLATTELDVLADDASVLTGVTIDDLKAGEVLPSLSGLDLPNPAEAPKAKQGNPPRSLRPMLAQSEDPAALDRRSFTGGDWLIEPKLDGIRAVATIVGGEVKLRSRNNIDLTNAYPSVVAALARQPAEALMLDGELVAPRPNGAPSFELLQQRMNLIGEGEIEQADAEIPVIYYAFDLLHIDGTDLRGTPLWLRKEYLARAVDSSAFVGVLEPIEAPPRRVFEALVAQGFEGVVAKRRGSRYVTNKRTSDWVKFKSQQTDDFVVGGYTQGNGARASTFGALVLGKFREDGALSYVGRVGSGFRDAQLDSTRALLDGLASESNPFDEEPPDAKTTSYVRPTLVVEAKFAEVTSGGQLRAPVFLRLRDDLLAGEIRADGGASPTPSSGEPGVVAQLGAAGNDALLMVDGVEVKVTNLDKEMWPGHGEVAPVTKRDLLVYYTEIAPFLLPHLADRPLTLTRFPDGVEGKSFYQKHWAQKRPAFVEPISIYSEDAQENLDFLLCNNLPTLLWLGQLADIALHVSLARAARGPGKDGQGLGTTYTDSRKRIEASLLNHPDFLLFDLDPFIAEKGSSVVEKNTLTRQGFEQTAATALWLKEILDGAGLRSFVKTSGASGIHVFVPIVRNLRYDVVRAICSTIAGALVSAHPKEVTTQFPKEKRVGKVYIDVNQNGRIRSLAAIYSPRVNPGAPVSMPLRWDEVAGVDPLAFNLWNAADRARASGDLWSRILDAKQDIKSLVDL